MSQLTDCPSCGGLLPVGKRCCPHCHCKYPAMKRWRLVAAAALGVGAGCSDRPLSIGVASHDASSDASTLPVDSSVSFEPAYGPPNIFFDLSTPADGGTE
jgi:hypothetical protein